MYRTKTLVLPTKMLGVVLFLTAQWVCSEYKILNNPADLQQIFLDAYLTRHMDGCPDDCDLGTYRFSPCDDGGRALMHGLVPTPRADGSVLWSVSLYEDFLMRETVFLNASGEEILRIASTPEDDAVWLADRDYVNAGPRDGIDDNGLVDMTGTAQLLFADEDLVKNETEGSDPRRSSGDRPRLTLPLRANAEGLKNTQQDWQSDVQIMANGGEGGRIFFVDSDIGRDTYDGSAATVELGSNCGPKASVQEALNLSVSGDVIELSGQGVFPDQLLSPEGKSVVLRPVGHVRF